MSLVDTLMKEVFSYVIISEAYRAEEAAHPGAERTPELEEDERKLLPQLAKAMGVPVKQFDSHLKEYDLLRLGHDPDMQAAIMGQKNREDGSLNPDYFALNGMMHVMQTIGAKDLAQGRTLGMMTVKEDEGIDFANAHHIGLQSERNEIKAEQIRRKGDNGFHPVANLTAVEAGALDEIVHAGDFGSLFRFPTDDRDTPQGNPLLVYLANLGTFKANRQSDVESGFLDMDSPLAKNMVYRWLRLAEQEDLTTLDDNAKGTARFVKEHLRELIVGCVRGVGYDSFTPEKIPGHEEVFKDLYCKEAEVPYVKTKDGLVPMDIAIFDMQEDLVEQLKQTAYPEVDPNDHTKITKFRAMKGQKKNEAGETVTVYLLQLADGKPRELPVEYITEQKGTTVDDFIDHHTGESMVRAAQLHDTVETLIKGQYISQEMANSYEIQALFKMYDAYKTAAKSDAEGAALDAHQKGKFSPSEQHLFVEFLEAAGYASRTSDLIMGVERDPKTHKPVSASFDNMEAIYDSKAYKHWRKSDAHSAWKNKVDPSLLRRAFKSSTMPTVE